MMVTRYDRAARKKNPSQRAVLARDHLAANLVAHFIYFEGFPRSFLKIPH